MAKKRKRSTLRKAREAVDRAVDSLVKGGKLSSERAEHVTLRVGGLPQLKLGHLKRLNTPRKI